MPKFLERPVDWLNILTELCGGDVFGHESWFQVGVEQHKEYIYCFIGDCTATPEDGENIIYNKPVRENAQIFVGTSTERWGGMEKAIIIALARAFSFLAGLPYCKDYEYNWEKRYKEIEKEFTAEEDKEGKQ